MKRPSRRPPRGSFHQECITRLSHPDTNAIVVVTSRTVFAMSRDRMLPAPFAAVSARTGSPWVAVVINGLLIEGVAVVGTVSMSSSTGGFLYVLHFVPPLLALVRLRRDNAGERPAFSTPAPRIVVN